MADNKTISNKTMTIMFSAKNIAFHRPTLQSSSFGHRSSSLSVDGDFNPDEKFCSHTKLGGEFSPWWAVQLDRVFHIRRIIITNRVDFGRKNMNTSSTK